MARVVIVVDTNIFIEHARTGKSPLLELSKSINSKNCRLVTPTVVIAELWSGQSMDNEKTEKWTVSLLSKIEIINLDKKIAMLAGQLIRTKQVYGNDAIIAATTLAVEGELLTLNKKDFTKVKGLKLV
jgi:predicted nucleic acid-binding protein